MKCERIEVRLSGYLDRELTQQQRQSVEVHLRDCGRCREVLDQLKAAKKAAQQLDVEQLEDREWSPLHENLLEKTGRRLGWGLLLFWIAASGAYGLWQLAVSPSETLAPKIVLFTLILGLGLLFLSVLSQRLRESRRDRYKGVLR